MELHKIARGPVYVGFSDLGEQGIARNSTKFQIQLTPELTPKLRRRRVSIVGNLSTHGFHARIHNTELWVPEILSR